MKAAVAIACVLALGGCGKKKANDEPEVEAHMKRVPEPTEKRSV